MQERRTEAEIAELEDAVAREEHVLRLDVPVDDLHTTVSTLPML